MGEWWIITSYYGPSSDERGESGEMIGVPRSDDGHRSTEWLEMMNLGDRRGRRESWRLMGMGVRTETYYHGSIRRDPPS
jgi:hypothetical protein